MSQAEAAASTRLTEVEVKSGGPSLQLPLEFVSFLQENDLSPSFYAPLLKLTHVPSRFIHPVNRPSGLDGGPRLTKEDISKELGIPLSELVDVPWLPKSNFEFWRLPGGYRVHCPSFKSGMFQALDAGSGVAIHALDLQPDDNVLDLCFAPGGKGALCGEVLRDGRGTVTAVDFSEARLNVAMSQLKKYGNHTKTRYARADGTTFDVGAPRLNVHWKGREFGLGREAEQLRDKEEDRTWAGWQRDPLQVEQSPAPVKMRDGKLFQQKSPEAPFVPYDKVLVDAECTHDGSIAHILKYIHRPTTTPSRPSSPDSDQDSPPPSPTLQSSPTTIAFPQAFLDSIAQSRTTLPPLQLGLLRNGFRLLRPGGILVYATCSQAVNQGERLVETFLRETNADGSRCEVEDVPGRAEMPTVERDERYLGGKGLRFSGEYVEGCEDEWLSALFVCRLRKIR